MKLEKETSKPKLNRGSMQAVVLKSLDAKNFEDEFRWGRKLAMTYAKQLDRAEDIMREVLDSDIQTNNPQILTRMKQLEKLLDAQTTIGNIGPKLLSVMEKMGMTPVAAKPAGKEATSDNSQQYLNQPEDELGRLREQRRVHKTGG